jgi:GNAT superfamily N-acetyltransferase
MSELAISIETPPTKPTLEAIDHGLDVYNAQFSPEHFTEFAVVLKAEDGSVKGGTTAIVWAGMLFIKWFWIDETLRRKGHGRALLTAAEDEGRRLGCSAVWLDTFEFQARPFYEKHGYKLFGTLDYPAGFKRFFMQKTL